MEAEDFAATTRIGTSAASTEQASLSVPRAVLAGPSFAPSVFTSNRHIQWLTIREHSPPALEKYLIQSKGLKGSGAAKLIEQATSDGSVFVFAELAEATNIADLAQHEKFASHYRLLELFAFQTWRDYREAIDQYPPLNTAQIIKLKQLSLITLAAKARQLPYPLLLELLELNDVRQLEDLIIETIYAGLLKGRLDQRRRRLDVEWTFGRDVNAAKVEMLGKDLSEWSSQIKRVILLLDDQISKVKGSEYMKAQEKEHYVQTVNSHLMELSTTKAKSGRSNTHRGDADDDHTGGGGFLGGPRNSPKKSGGSSTVHEPKEDVMDVDDDFVAGKRSSARGARKRQRP